MSSYVKLIVIGIVLAAVFILVVHSIPPQPARQIIALFLAFISCVYIGALLSQRLAAPFVGLELAVAIIVFSLAVVGLRASTTSLALGYVVHGIWSLVHRPRLVPTQVASWFPPLCAAFAFVVALALLFGPWRPMA
jgi:hypothetical protein